MPLVSPTTEQVSAPVVVQVFAPGDEVTVYPVIAEPPFDAGADQVAIQALTGPEDPFGVEMLRQIAPAILDL